MDFLRRHILIKGLSLLLIWTLLLPSGIKFLHIFEQHQHEVCLGEADVHFHTLDVECEFYKFKLNIPFTIPENNSLAVLYLEIKEAMSTDYSFLSEYQTLHFSLRGPPSLI